MREVHAQKREVRAPTRRLSSASRVGNFAQVGVFTQLCKKQGVTPERTPSKRRRDGRNCRANAGEMVEIAYLSAVSAYLLGRNCLLARLENFHCAILSLFEQRRVRGG